MRHRRKMRLLLCAATALLIGAGVALAYMMRSRQLEATAIASRDEGLRLIQQGEYRQAMHRLGIYVRRHPDDAQVLFEYARARQRNPEPNDKHLLDSMTLYRRVLSLSPGHAEASRALLDLYQLAGFTTETLDLAQQILQLDPDNGLALAAQVRTLMLRRDYEAASIAATRLAELAPFDIAVQAWALKAIRPTRGGQERVLQRAADLLLEYPGDPRFVVVQSIAFGLAERKDEAVQWARSAAAEPPQDAESLLVLVLHCDQLGLFSESLHLLQAAANGQATSPSVQLHLAQRLYQLGRNEEVVAVKGDSPELAVLKVLALVALERHPEAAAALVLQDDGNLTGYEAAWKPVLGLLADPAHDKAALMRTSRQAIALWPGDPHLHMVAAQAYGTLGEGHAQVESLLAAAKLAPAWPAPLIRLAQISLAAGRWEDAAEIGKSILERSTTNAEALYLIAAAETASCNGRNPGALQRASEACAAFEVAAPGDARAIPMRVHLLAKSQNRTGAVEAARQALAQSPPIPASAMLHLAEICREQLPELEGECLNRCEQVHGTSGGLLLMKARWLHSDGLADQALKALDEAVAASPASEVEIRAARAQFLELIQAPSAARAWMELADSHPQNVAIQWRAMESATARQELEFVQRTLVHLKELVGEESLNWRVARARLLLATEAAKDSPNLVQAALILNEVARESPSQVMPRMLLADALARLDNQDGALEQLMIAAGLDGDSVELALKLAKVLADREDRPQALAYLQRGLRSPRATAEQLQEAAELAAALGDPNSAIRALEEQQGGDRLPSLLLARLYRKAHEFDKLDALCTRLLEEPDPTAIGFVASYYLWRQRHNEAEAAMQKLDELQIDPVDALLVRGDYAMQSGQAALAAQHYRQAAALAPANPYAWGRLLEALLALDHRDEAIKVAREAVEALPGSVGIRAMAELLPRALEGPRDSGRVVLWLLEHPEDRSTIETCLTLLGSPASDETLVRLRTLAEANGLVLPLQNAAARHCLERGRWELALQISSRTVQSFGDDVDCARLKALALFTGQRWSEVAAAGNDWKQRNPADSLAADLLVSGALLRDGDVVEATQRVAAYEPSMVADLGMRRRLMIHKATLSIASGDFDGAAGMLRPMLGGDADVQVAWLAAAADSIPDAPMVVTWLREVAGSTANQGFSGQVALVDAAQRAADRLSDATVSGLAVEYRHRLNADAVAERVADEGALTAEQWLLLGMLNEKCHDPAAAISAYERALGLSPRHAIASNNLALLICDSDRDRALRLAETAATDMGPGRANFIDTLAAVHESRGELEPALANARKACELAPGSSTFKLRLARLLIAAGQGPQASALLDEMEKAAPATAGGAVGDEVTRLRSQLR